MFTNIFFEEVETVFQDSHGVENPLLFVGTPGSSCPGMVHSQGEKSGELARVLDAH